MNVPMERTTAMPKPPVLTQRDHSHAHVIPDLRGVAQVVKVSDD